MARRSGSVPAPRSSAARRLRPCASRAFSLKIAGLQNCRLQEGKGTKAEGILQSCNSAMVYSRRTWRCEMSIPIHTRRTAWAATAAVLMVAAVASRPRAAVEPPNAKDLTQGTWELNVAKSKFCGGNAPRGGGRLIEEVGFGMIAVS